MFLLYFVFFLQLFGKQYWFFVIVAFLGWILIWRTNRSLSIAVATYVVISLYLWVFKHYTHNVRYVVPIFGVIFVFAASGLGLIYQNLKTRWLSMLLITFFVFLALVFNKLELIPKTFYNPNLDIYGDVQIANYKKAYLLLKQRFPNYQLLAIINDIPFAQNWYLPEKKATAYFAKFTKEPYQSRVDGVMVYGTLKEFKALKNRYRQGLVIVEDWQSFLPESVKMYTKQYLDLEFTVSSLGGQEHDPWTLAVYSWGM